MEEDLELEIPQNQLVMVNCMLKLTHRYLSVSCLDGCVGGCSGAWRGARVLWRVLRCLEGCSVAFGGVLACLEGCSSAWRVLECLECLHKILTRHFLANISSKLTWVIQLLLVPIFTTFIR